MSGAKKMVPKRRFKKFLNAGDWEQCKLSDITEVIMGQSPSSKNYTDNPNDDILVQGNADLKDGKVVPRLWTKEITKTIDKGGIILTVRAPVGDVAKTDYKVVLGRGVAGIKGNDYIYQFLQKLQYNRYWVSLSSGSTFESINSNDIKDLIIDIPSIEEQTKISMLLNNVNSIITLHQRKLDKLQATKKALLQEMFPEEGQDKPKRRFKGFTDAWEQRKFLDLLDAQNGIRRGPFGSSLKKDSFVKKSDYVVYEQQNAIYDNYETRYFISQEKYNELIRFNIQPGDFIMSGAGTIGRISMVPDGIKKGVFNQALIRFKVNKDSINPLYFLKFMQSDMMQKQLTQANPGSAMTNLVPMDELKKWEVTIPSLEEQNRISTFINQIDEFITLHQRKLDKLKNLKQAYLNEMFV